MSTFLSIIFWLTWLFACLSVVFMHPLNSDFMEHFVEEYAVVNPSVLLYVFLYISSVCVCVCICVFIAAIRYSTSLRSLLSLSMVLKLVSCFK